MRLEQDAFIAAAVALRPNEIAPERLDEARRFVQDALERVDVICTRIEHDLQLPDRNDPVWRANAIAAQRVKMRARQRLQTLFGDINRRMREERYRNARETRERKFFRLVKERLGEEAYRDLWRIVDEEH